MSKLLVVTVVIGAMLTATAFAQAPAGQPSMQQPPAVSGQQSQPSGPSQQPAAPGQADRSAPQNGPASGGAASSAEAVARQLAQALSLNDTQTAQMKNVLEDEQSKLIALRDDRTMSSQDKQTKLMEIRRTASDKVMTILSPEQQKRLADLLQKQQQQQNPGAAPARPPQ